MTIQKYIVLKLDQEHYALPIHHVQTIERMLAITRIPNTKSFVRGVINLRGVITPVIDLRERMELEAKALDDLSRIMIINHEKESIGMIVDEANDVIELDTDKVESPPETISKQNQSYIEGVVKHNGRLIVLLSLDHIVDIELTETTT